MRSNNVLSGCVKIMSQLVFFVIILITFFYPLSARAFTFGLSPGKIDLGLVKADNVIRQSLTLMRTDSEEDESGTEMAVNVEIEGAGKEALQLDSTQAIFKKGETRKQFNFVLSPKNLIPGKYNLKLYFSPNRNFVSQKGNNLVTKVVSYVNFEVTRDTVIDLQMSDQPSLLYGFYSDKIKFNSVFKNFGNTAEVVDKIKLEIINNKTKKEMFYIPSSAFILEPKSTVSFYTTLNLPKDWSVGVYSANILYFNNDKVVEEIKNIKFDIQPVQVQAAKKGYKTQFLAIGFLGFIFIILLAKFIKK